MGKPLSTSEIDRLRKMQALFDSPNKGEGQAARDRAASLLKAHDMTLADIPSVLKQQVAPPPRADFLAGFDDWMERAEPGYKARLASEYALKARMEAEYRKAVIAKYGSAQAARKPNAMEL